MSPKTYRKKPVELEAMQFTTLSSYLDIVEWWEGQNIGTLTAAEMFEYRTPIMLVRTLEGTMAANPGDWIIRGVKGEFYPCREDIFAATYEEVQP